MKKLLSTVAVASLLAVPAFAQGSGQITGFVQPICEVQDLFGQQAFDKLEIDETVEDNFTILCNDEDGPTLQLTSAGGGLRADDDIGFDGTSIIRYTAAVSVPDVPAFDLSLTTNGTPNASVSGTSSDAAAALLAAPGGVEGTVLVTLREDAIWAGGYSDTIQLDVIAN